MEALEVAGVEFIPDGGRSLAGGAGVRRAPGPVEEPEVAVAKVTAELEPDARLIEPASGLELELERESGERSAPARRV